MKWGPPEAAACTESRTDFSAACTQGRYCRAALGARRGLCAARQPWGRAHLGCLKVNRPLHVNAARRRRSGPVVAGSGNCRRERVIFYLAVRVQFTISQLNHSERNVTVMDAFEGAWPVSLESRKLVRFRRQADFRQITPKGAFLDRRPGRDLATEWSTKRPIGRGDRVVLQCGDAFVSCMTSAGRGNRI